MTHSRTLRLLALLLILSPAYAHAWGPDGHRIIADLADSHLTPKSKAAVADLLDGKSLDEVANWADEQRKEHPEWASWHFVDIPFEARSFDAARDGRNGDNIVEKTVHFVTVLADNHAAQKDRAEALKLLVHFVGDLHQPLHCITRDDAGGNKRLVYLLDAPRAANLHSVWDSGILKRILNGTSDKVFAAALDARVSKADLAQWSAGSPETWANESHAVAVKDAYAHVPADGPPPKLNEEYVSTAEQDIKLQLTKSGLRLAWILNHILG